MKRFLSCLLTTYWCFLLGNCVLLWPVLIGYYIFGWDALDPTQLTQRPYGLWIVIVVGIFSVALAIWDGQFVEGYVKETHWINRKDNSSL